MSVLKKIDPISIPAVENSLALFDIMPTTVAFNRTHTRELLPIMNITRNGPFTFRLFSDNQFIDFSKTWLFLKTSIQKKGANDVWENPDPASVNDQHVGVIQNYASSFIKQLKITINSTNVFDSDVLYPWRAYISTEFGTDASFRHGMLEAGGYFSDTPGKEMTGEENEGLMKRAQQFWGGKQVSNMTQLNFDLAHQSNLFINNTDIIFEIWPQSDSFLFQFISYKPKPTKEGQNPGPQIPEGTFRIVIHDIRLFVTLVDVNQSLQNQIAKTMESTPAKYSMRKMLLRHVYLPKGLTNITWNVFQSIVPRRLLVFFIDNEAFHGDSSKPPFKFEDAGVQSICVEANNQIVPDYPYRFDFSSKTNTDWVRAFIDFYSSQDIVNGERDIKLDLYKYTHGWTIFSFTLASSYRDIGDSFELIKNGTTVIKTLFNKPIEDPGYMLVALGEFDEVLSINADRILSVDGSI